MVQVRGSNSTRVPLANFHVFTYLTFSTRLDQEVL